MRQSSTETVIPSREMRTLARSGQVMSLHAYVGKSNGPQQGVDLSHRGRHGRELSSVLLRHFSSVISSVISQSSVSH